MFGVEYFSSIPDNPINSSEFQQVQKLNSIFFALIHFFYLLALFFNVNTLPSKMYRMNWTFSSIR